MSEKLQIDNYIIVLPYGECHELRLNGNNKIKEP